MRLLISIALLLVSAPALWAQAEAPLPVRKVVLYKNGVGYFEHRGQTRAAGPVAIELPSSQLDDVLKSLTVIDLGGGGQVAGVSYTTLAPLDRRLDEIAIDLTSTEGLAHFLNQIKGARIEVQTGGGVVSGKLMGADVKTREVGSNGTVQTTEALVFTAQGQVRAIELGSAASIRLLDSELSAQVSRYLDLLRTRHERDVRRLEIETLGASSRSLQVSYTSEAPIWKTTYRLALEEGEKPLLQGWAIVDNVSAMDWDGVELSLVAGAPVSFIQNLSQPIYSRRPTVPLPEGVQVAPQTHGAALDVSGEETRVAGTVTDSSGMALPGALVEVFERDGDSAGEAYADEDGEFEIAVSPGTYRVAANLPGFMSREYREVSVSAGRTRQLDFTLEIGGVSETVTVTGESPMVETEMLAKGRARGYAGGVVGAAPPPPAAPISRAIRQARLETAQAGALGDQFEYRLPNPVIIGRNRSALLPIVQTEVAGEKVSIYNEGSGDPRPRLAVSLVNETGLTLDAGSFTVLDADAFAGEGLTDVIRPKEKRILSYGLDLHLDVAVRREGAPERVTRVAIGQGVFRRQVKLRRKAAYAVRNQDDQRRVVLIEHPVENEWTLVETPAPAETTVAEYRFRVEAAPGVTTELVVQEESNQETTYALSNVSSDQIALWLDERTIDADVERVLRQVVAKRGEVDAVRREIQSRESEQQNIFNDQGRLRENLGKLGDSSEEKGLRRRYVTELEAQENRLAAIRAERAKLEEELRKLQAELDALVRDVAFEKSF
jgi:Carboxypeptidase regulatory-like domain